MKVVIDTCVWVAAVRSRRGASFALLAEIPNGRYQYGISVPLFLEYQASLMSVVAKGEVLLTAGHVDAVLSAIAHFAREVPIYYRLRPNLKDEGDNMVFECAANFGADAIITHNIRDFRRSELKGYGIDIVRPDEFLFTIRRDNEDIAG